MTGVGKRIMVLVHPGSACGSADFNLGHDAAPLRDALAAEIMHWDGDMLVVDGSLSDELRHYAVLGIALDSARDRADRSFTRLTACDETDADWPETVAQVFNAYWPGGPHDVVVTGAWRHADGTGCVGTMASRLSRHRVTVADTAFTLP